MKRETQARKLAEILGITDQLPEIMPEAVPKSKSSVPIGMTGVEFDDIEKHREAQALHLFLLAPNLFTIRSCSRCGETFAVSRKFVGFCSYTCMKHALEDDGIDFVLTDKIDEQYAIRVWDDNEPLRVSTRALRALLEFAREHEELLEETVA